MARLVKSSRRFDFEILDLNGDLIAGLLWLDVNRQACRLIGWIERLQICCLICFYVGSRMYRLRAIAVNADLKVVKVSRRASAR